ncbi:MULTISPECIES: hypothetical protein [unclassified Tatumella]|uniref:hypothetical protein n=1 Tax=unclassified Tatumella TaxID=2649542 RepID=UPI001BAFB066|nr:MULTISPECIES: hypothetical protein [unclassified Tatumella]MBS0855796.1 hypothetical protein [Tatumella sp. JGM16]MBS0912704.1 hypothetical protein [Tatumella sp. JGM91]
MQILSHRGLWKTVAEKNTVTAFRRAFSQGFGCETDIRDFNGQLVISHDMAQQGCLLFCDFLQLHASYDYRLPLALNIKSDGLAMEIRQHLQFFKIENYFCFDMSVPDMHSYIAAGVKTYGRISEFETENLLFRELQGLWLDSFLSGECDVRQIEYFLRRGAEVCCVSPELHQRDHRDYWQQLSHFTAGSELTDQLMLCTDRPENAREVWDE